MRKVKQVKSSGHKSKGTHGSLSKAGKMRDQNRVQWELRERKSKRSKLRLKHIKKHRCPRVAKRKSYEKLINKPKKDFEKMKRGFR